MRYVLFLLFFSGLVQAQTLRKPIVKKDSITNAGDTLVIDNGKKDSLKVFKPTINDYRFKTENSEYRTIDTTFTAQHSYEYTQYNNRDNFGKIQFANIGAGFQDLMYRWNPNQTLTLLPTNKSHFIIGIDDVKYYDVKTPTTSFLYHTAMRNGAALNSRYTQNFGKRFNFAVEYMGLRSMGFYNNNLAANNNTLFSGRYDSKNGRYQLYAHYLHQNVNNEENGGIKDLDLFLGGDSRFNNRANVPVNFADTDSRFFYRRYYLSQSFLPFDQEKMPFKIKHALYYQTNKYWLNLGASDGAYYEAFYDDGTNKTKKYSKDLSNTLSLVFDKPNFYLDAGFRHQRLILGARRSLSAGDYFQEYDENRIGAVGNLRINLWDKLDLKSKLEFSNGKRFGTYVLSDNQLRFEPIKDFFVDADVVFQSAAPSFNYLLNYSSVLTYNYNFMNFSNESMLKIGGKAGLKWFDAQVFANVYRIDNYTYINQEGQPNQSSNSLNISQVGGEAKFKYNKWNLNTRVQFQSNLTNKDLFPAPNFIGRANLYWKSPAFKKAADIMAGIKLYYFTKFNSREYSPLLSEFMLPSSRGYEIGGQPIAEVYVNMKVKTMQFYIEAQNVTTPIMQNKSFAAPYYPLYDFRLNIGILWNLFH